jgi:hypothetical protein
MRAPKDGSGTPSAFVAVTSPTDIALTGRNLYWLQTYTMDSGLYATKIEETPLVDGGLGTPLNSWDDPGPFRVPSSLTSNGSYLAAIVSNGINNYVDVIDPATGAVVLQVSIASATVAGAIDSTDVISGQGDHCPNLNWSSLPDAGGAAGSINADPNARICPGEPSDPTVMAGNHCAVFWSSASTGVALAPKGQGTVYAVGASTLIASAMVADENAVYVATSTTIARIAVQ